MTRWDALFDDLGAQSEALRSAERAAEIEERTRIEVGSLAMHDRLAPATGSTLRLRLAGQSAVIGTLRRLGSDWLLLDEGGGREALVRLAAVVSISGLGRTSSTPGAPPGIDRRLSLRHVLRAIARDRSVVRVVLVDGSVLDATLDRVGGDFVEAALHAAGESRRRGDVREIQLVAQAAIAAVRRDA